MLDMISRVLRIRRIIYVHPLKMIMLLKKKVFFNAKIYSIYVYGMVV